MTNQEVERVQDNDEEPVDASTDDTAVNSQGTATKEDNDDVANAVDNGKTPENSQGTVNTKSRAVSAEELKVVAELAKQLEKADPATGIAILTKAIIIIDKNLAFRAFRKVWNALPAISQGSFAGTNILGMAREFTVDPITAKVIRWFVAVGLLEIKKEDSAKVAKKSTGNLKLVGKVATVVGPTVAKIFAPEVVPFIPVIIPLIQASGKLAEKGDDGLAQVREAVVTARTAREEVPRQEKATHNGVARADPIAVKPEGELIDLATEKKRREREMGVRSDMSNDQKQKVRDAGLIGKKGANDDNAFELKTA